MCTFLIFYVKRNAFFNANKMELDKNSIADIYEKIKEHVSSLKYSLCVFSCSIITLSMNEVKFTKDGLDFVIDKNSFSQYPSIFEIEIKIINNENQDFSYVEQQELWMYISFSTKILKTYSDYINYKILMYLPDKKMTVSFVDYSKSIKKITFACYDFIPEFKNNLKFCVTQAQNLKSVTFKENCNFWEDSVWAVSTLKEIILINNVMNEIKFSNSLIKKFKLVLHNVTGKDWPKITSNLKNCIELHIINTKPPAEGEEKYITQADNPFLFLNNRLGPFEKFVLISPFEKIKENLLLQAKSKYIITDTDMDF